MATRARIGFEKNNGEIVSSYHHYDGYPAGLGYNLVKNYSDPLKFEKAVMLGDASYWGSKIEPTSENHSFMNPEDDVNVYYGRDRGETDVECLVFANFNEFVENYNNAGEEYGYVLRKDGKLSMIFGRTVSEDAEDDIIVARANSIAMHRSMND